MKRLFVFVAALMVCGAGCAPASSIQPVPPSGSVACTMEAKQCPDGSYVGRSGSKCEFAACPAQKPAPTPQACHGIGDSSCGSGYQCVQDCGPPVVRVGDLPPPYHCQTDAIASRPRMCPI